MIRPISRFVVLASYCTPNDIILEEYLIINIQKKCCSPHNRGILFLIFGSKRSVVVHRKWNACSREGYTAFGRSYKTPLKPTKFELHFLKISSFQETPNENGRLHFENHGILFCHIDYVYSFESRLQRLVETQKPGEATEAARHQRYSLQAFVW